MSTVYFAYEADRHNTSERDPDDEWSRASTATTWTMPSYASLSNDSPFHYPEGETVTATLKPGMTIFLCTVIYSTGDSFGHDSGAYCETIGLYATAALAEQARDAIERDRATEPNYTTTPTCFVPTFDGTLPRPIQTYSWKGYFESIDSLEITELKVVE